MNPDPVEADPLNAMEPKTPDSVTMIQNNFMTPEMSKRLRDKFGKRTEPIDIPEESRIPSGGVQS